MVPGSPDATDWSWQPNSTSLANPCISGMLVAHPGDWQEAKVSRTRDVQKQHEHPREK